MDVNNLLTKNGFAITKIALQLLNVPEHSYIPRVADFAGLLKIGRGTVQTALRYLEEQNAIRLENRGHLGTYLTYIDRKRLWKLTGLQNILGSMPLPYTKHFEGLATALYETLEHSDIPFNMAYVRGCITRFKGLLDNRYDFAVCSRFAAERNMKDYPGLTIAFRLGDLSYVGDHVILYRRDLDLSVLDQVRLKVGMYPNSFDHESLTMKAFAGRDIELLVMPNTQIIEKLSRQEIDATVWNLNEFREPTLNFQVAGLNFDGEEEAQSAFREAVIVISQEKIQVFNVLKEVIDVERIRSIQHLVMNGEKLPRY